MTWKNLTLFQKKPLLESFNEIYRTKIIPQDWPNILISPIYRNEDHDEPSNYRPISLLNTSLKLFTQILCTRLITWSERNSKLSNFQFAYRKNQGCEDDIFTLHSIITKRIHVKNKPLFSTLIDLSQAFDSVEHSLLWKKLKQKGLSSKFIVICQAIYKKANAKIKTPNGITNSIPIERQGETLSPILFILFLDDIIETLNKSETLPLNMGNAKIHILIYADDMVLLGHTAFQLHQKINIVAKFLLQNGLKVNTSKTKVLVFGKKQPKNLPILHWGNEKLEIVTQYTYLGVPVNSTLSSKFTPTHFQTQTKIALSNLFSLFYKAKIDKFETQQKLFHSLVRSVLLYCALGNHLRRTNGNNLITIFESPVQITKIYPKMDTELGNKPQIHKN